MSVTESGLQPITQPGGLYPGVKKRKQKDLAEIVQEMFGGENKRQ